MSRAKKATMLVILATVLGLATGIAFARWLPAAASDRVGTVAPPRSPAKSVFAIDMGAPVITSYPSNPSSSSDARFTFRGGEPRMKFQCRLDGGRFSPCVSPIRYRNLRAGFHTFSVRATRAAAATSNAAEHLWQISPAMPFKISVSGHVPGSLYPGARAKSIPVTLSNPTGGTIYFTSATVSVRSSAASGCRANWFRTSPVNVPSGGIAVPANSSVALPVEGATAPTIQMIESGTDQDACRNSMLALRYAWSAHGAAIGERTPARLGSLSGLPFTGLELWLVAGSGVLLGLAGIALHRVTRRSAVS